MESSLGHTQSKALILLAQEGPNSIQVEKRFSRILLFLLQFKSPLVLVLIFACAVSFMVGESLDALAILTILLVNAGIGFFLEQRAEVSIEALQSLTAPRAKVVRDGIPQLILARDVVRGDVILFEAGDVVAADSTILSSTHLLVNEAILTGESVPVEKKGTRDSLFMGTTVVAGTARGKVHGVGMNTELGRIAHLLKGANVGPTPLEVQLKKIGTTLLWLCFGIVGVVFLVGIRRDTPFTEVFIYAVSLAVAAVPEGMLAIVTIAMALGVQRLAAKNAYIRRLPCVETLGSVSIICTDKTGTLTTGHMRVREVWGEDHGQILKVAASCIDAEKSDVDQAGSGDPTEVAILLAAAEMGLEKHIIEKENPRVSSLPFTAERRRMSIFRRDGINYVKGAVESILPLCKLSKDKAEVVLKNMNDMTSRGLRVLAIATGATAEEKDLIFVGLLGIADPPRKEVVEAIQEARRAGIRTVMITGDHPLTAAAIAQEIGLVKEGEDFASRVFARSTPEEKLQLVRKWKGDGKIVAMTGDGVNDAPALKEAHVGIAMGKGGSEVTRQAADLVLADDNFASIIAAVREGRNIFKSIRRALIYLLSGNFAEVIIVMATLFLGMPVPFLAAHLLWINLVTDSLPALTLMAEPLAPDTMSVPPRPLLENILGASQWIRILSVGCIEAAVVFIFYFYNLKTHGVADAQGLAFTTLVFSQLFRSFGARSEKRIFFEVGIFSNLWLWSVVILTGIVQLSLHVIPLTQKIFKLKALSLAQCVAVILCALITVSIVELLKVFKRPFKSPEIFETHPKPGDL